MVDLMEEVYVVILTNKDGIMELSVFNNEEKAKDYYLKHFRPGILVFKEKVQ